MERGKFLDTEAVELKNAKHTMITAHSGCDGTPDNSIAFLRYAAGTGVDCLEVDVRLNSHGTLVLAHDTEAVDPPTLQQAFGIIRSVPGLLLNCDLKKHGLEQAIWRLAKEERVSDRLIYSGDVSAAAMADEPAMAAAVRWYFNLELRFPRIYTDPSDGLGACSAAYVALELGKTMRMVHADCLNLNWKLWSTALWDALLRAKIPLSVWTPDSEAHLRFFLGQGVANITTRQADRALGLRRGMEESGSPSLGMPLEVAG